MSLQSPSTVGRTLRERGVVAEALGRYKTGSEAVVSSRGHFADFGPAFELHAKRYHQQGQIRPSRERAAGRRGPRICVPSDHPSDPWRARGHPTLFPKKRRPHVDRVGPDRGQGHNWSVDALLVTWLPE